MAHIIGSILGVLMTFAIIYGAQVFWNALTGKKKDDTTREKNDE